MANLIDEHFLCEFDIFLVVSDRWLQLDVCVCDDGRRDLKLR